MSDWTFLNKHRVRRGHFGSDEASYPSCNSTNILTDQIYSAFFFRMLKDNLGKGVDAEIKELIDEINDSKPNGA